MPETEPQRRHRGPLSRAGTAYVRTRTATACQVCRARRAKCDNERPCTNCRRIGATCTSEPASSTAGFDPASLAILTKLQDLESEVKALSSRLHQPGDASTHVSPAQVPLGLHLDQHLQHGNLAQVLAWDVWQPHVSPRDFGPIGPIHAVQPSPPSRPSDSGIDFSLFAGYLNDFFRNVHVLNPILDEGQIRGQLTNFQLNGIGWDASSCLLLLVLSNGACSSAYGRTSAAGGSYSERSEQRLASAQALYDAAEKRKDTLWRADYLTQARCHFFSGIFMMVLMQPFDAWRYFLQGLATCQRLVAPSHRQRLRDSAQEENQAEESIYWSCWKSERELRFELDVPDFTSAVFDHPVMFPTLPRVTDQEELRAWYFYLAEISLWRFEMTARRSMADLVRESPNALDSLAERVIELEMTLVSWQDTLPDMIRLDSRAESDNTDVLLFVLRGRLTYNYEVLTWPFLEMLILFGEHSSTPRATELAAKAVHMHHERLSINRPGFFHLHHGTWLMQCSSARSACVLLAVARSASARLLPTDWLELVSDTVAMLEYWGEKSYIEVIVFLKSVLLDFTR